jgi:hypothetical protein
MFIIGRGPPPYIGAWEGRGRRRSHFSENHVNKAGKRMRGIKKEKVSERSRRVSLLFCERPRKVRHACILSWNRSAAFTISLTGRKGKIDMIERREQNINTTMH